MKYTHAFYTLTVITGVWLGCADETPLRTTAQGCSLSSECTSPLVCAFAKCHQACKSSRDCSGKGERCVQSDKPYYVCQKQGCSRNSECLGKQTCAVDGQCRDQCLTQKDCLSDQVCTGGVCADTEELVSGVLPSLSPDGDSGAGQRCALPTDCPGDLVCLRGGVCGPECIGDKDCLKTYMCKPLRDGGAGRCVPERDAGATDASTSDVSAPPSVTSIVAGGAHTCAIFPSGKLKCWGYNEGGQLGLGDLQTRGDAPGEMGNALPYVDVGTGRSVKAIAGGGFHECAILDNDRLKCWGTNDEGQLGLGDVKLYGGAPNEMGDALPYVDLGVGRTVKAVAGGVFHTCAILDNNRVKCWGRNNEGQLGLGDTQNRGDGPNEMGDALPYVDLGTGRTAKAVSAGFLHTCVLLDSDQVKCWGSNNLGQSGLGDTQNRGDGPNEMGDALPVVNLGTGRSVKYVDAGVGDHNCAILDNDRVKCWGLNIDGHLGLGDTQHRGIAPGQMGDALPYVDFGTGRTAIALGGAGDASCVLLDNHRVKCWGRAEYGLLGYGDTQNRGGSGGQMGDALPYVDLGTGRTVKTVVVGGFHACAILDNDRFKCWGGGYAQLGLGESGGRGDAPGQMGDALPYVEPVGP